MADEAFNTAMTKRGIKGLKLDREIVINLFTEIEERVSSLPMDQDSVAKLDDEIASAKTEIANVRCLNKIFGRALLGEHESVVQADGFKLDQKQVRQSIIDLEHVIETCKKNLIDAGCNLAQPNVGQVTNGDLAALIEEMKNSTKLNADGIKALSEASADASKANTDAIKSLVKSTAANVKLSNATNSQVLQKMVNKNQTPRMMQPKFSPADSIQDYRFQRVFKQL